MTKTTVFCDICGEELREDTSIRLGSSLNMGGVLYLPTTHGSFSIQFDLCSACTNNIKASIDNLIELHGGLPTHKT